MTPLFFCSAQSLSCVRLFCDPMDCSTPGFPVHHQLLEFTQTHVHRVGNAVTTLVMPVIHTGLEAPDIQGPPSSYSSLYSSTLCSTRNTEGLKDMWMNGARGGIS